ncbi:MAG TPA: energy transducer TonB, partial [Puia sp.]|nr:energy transducer TonB [Puia sp.]
PNDSLGLKGIVIVSFTVDKKKRLSDFYIEQSLGPDYDTEAIRLIKEGPSWKLIKKKSATVVVVVGF